MEVKSCRRCGNLFQHVMGPEICQLCKKKDEEDFQRVKEYLYENPGASMSVVCEELGVTVKQVRQYLREGRLTVSPDSPIRLECERCNAPILTGAYCDSCRNEMSNQFSSVAKEMKSSFSNDKPAEKNRMRYLDSGNLRKRR